jgi:hypothetical protein
LIGWGKVDARDLRCGLHTGTDTEPGAPEASAAPG